MEFPYCKILISYSGNVIFTCFTNRVLVLAVLLGTVYKRGDCGASCLVLIAVFVFCLVRIDYKKVGIYSNITWILACYEGPWRMWFETLTELARRWQHSEIGCLVPTGRKHSFTCGVV
ncbi:hypothetical protein VNO80_26703 [Phaseolus coccineus]|uniref:Uncharacterized protein n=1 Tax=Phaseolus coccineus TaxID=3886 RepID=A0AAN9LF98_PHACN